MQKPRGDFQKYEHAKTRLDVRSGKPGQCKVIICLMLLAVSSCVPASWASQASTTSPDGAASLPDAPGRGLGGARQQGAEAEATGRISGTIADINGSVVPDAQVELVSEAGLRSRQTTSDAAGRFAFLDVPAGAFQLRVASSGLQPVRSKRIVLAAGETRELPPVVLAIATAITDVQVSANPEQVAAAQVQLAEKQRVLGIVPNFYTSYIWSAAPLTPKLKFSLAVHSTLDPVAFLLASGVAGVEQAHHTFPAYGTGSGAYGKRFGAAYADNVVGRMMGSAVLPSLFHQDPRYFYKGKGSATSRAIYAVGATFIARGDNGRPQPNYSHILGNFAAAGISNLYRASGDRSATLTIRNGFIITGTNAVGNLVREFVLKQFTTQVPAFAKGEP